MKLEGQSLTDSAVSSLSRFSTTSGLSTVLHPKPMDTI